jgi:uncharacterized membrane protein (DUF485 family)
MSDQPHDLYEAEHADRRNARRGLLLFWIYFAVYAAFFVICAFRWDLMKTQVFGVSLAIAYGFGLIGFAFVLAVIYMFLTKSPPPPRPGE